MIAVGGRVEAVATGAVAGRKAVDFENLAFAQGNHLMTNKKCDLPQKSYRAAHKVSCAGIDCAILKLKVTPQSINAQVQLKPFKHHVQCCCLCLYISDIQSLFARTNICRSDAKD